MEDSSESEGASLTTDATQSDSKLVPKEQGSRDLSLLEVARIVHEKGNDFAPALYDSYAERFETTTAPPQRPLRIVDDARQVICRQDRDPKTRELQDLRQITLFIGPSTQDHEVIIGYPRASFFYTKKDERWNYKGAQVGIRGAMIGTKMIIAQHKGQGDVRAYLLENHVSMNDLERLIRPYLSGKSDVLRLE